VSGGDAERFARALAAIDAANADDPNQLVWQGEARPKELLHAERVSHWVERLAPDASEALRLAARAHHLRRWALPRSGFPDGRAGYHAWRRALQQRHADEAGALLREAGYDPALIARVADLIRKRGLGRDPEVQVLEDALCLVFVETQLAEFATRHAQGKVLGILEKSLRKMSPAGREAAAGIELGAEERALLGRAVERL
jgi:hypothetical protein